MSDRLEELCLKVRASTNDKWFDKAKAELQSYIDAEITKGLLKNPSKLRIGMLRQALNEDRITDPNKMVDNQYIEHWLGIKELKLKGEK